ncbi:hypothetical protein [Salinisphaera sp. Q1T1-3]|nr:hypothetical protein [Salinisphaera sp. Q1T1-3]
MTAQPRSADRATDTPNWQVGALWALVTIPAAWGFIETVWKSVALFTG